MLSRVAGRLFTGPLAFLVAGVIDVTLFALLAARERMRRSSIWRR